MKKNWAEYVEEALDRGGYDLTRNIPTDFISKMVKETGKSREQIRALINTIRKERHIHTQRLPKRPNSKHNKVIEMCQKAGLIRSSNKQGVVTRAIIKFILNNLPLSGAALMIGTAGPFFHSKMPSMKNTIIDDEYGLAIMLRYTSDKFTIIVGNGVSKRKARIKADQWRASFILRPVDVEEDIVDRDSFSSWISRIAEKHSVCKVVLLTSGSWTGQHSSKEHGIDANFKSPAEYLSKTFRNLHILAIRRRAEYSFDAIYLHNGSEKIIYSEVDKVDNEELLQAAV